MSKQEDPLDDEGPLDPSVFDGLFDDLLEENQSTASQDEPQLDETADAITAFPAAAANVDPVLEPEIETFETPLDNNGPLIDESQLPPPAETASSPPAGELANNTHSQTGDPYAQDIPKDDGKLDHNAGLNQNGGPDQTNKQETTEMNSPGGTSDTNVLGLEQPPPPFEPAVTVDLDEFLRQQALAEQPGSSPGAMPTETAAPQATTPKTASPQLDQITNETAVVPQEPAPVVTPKTVPVAKAPVRTPIISQTGAQNLQLPQLQPQIQTHRKSRLPVFLSVGFASLIGAGLGLWGAKIFTDRQAEAAPPETTTAAAPTPAPAPDNDNQSNRIRFSPGTEKLDPESGPVIDELAQLLSSDQNAVASIKVRTYSETTGEQNLDLSRRQADVLTNLLLSQGADKSQLKVEGLGDPLLDQTEPVDNFLIFTAALDESALNAELENLNTFTVGVDPESGELRNESRSELELVGEAAKAESTTTLTIAAYSFREPTEPANETVAKLAADKAAEFLKTNYGVEVSRIIVVGQRQYVVSPDRGNHIDTRWVRAEDA